MGDPRGSPPPYERLELRLENTPSFRRLPPQHDRSYSFPEKPHNRKITDVVFLIIFAICVLVQVFLALYAMSTSHIRQLSHGYDNCGNFCGLKNEEIEDIPCSGKDMTDKPHLYVNTVWVETSYSTYERENRTCVSTSTYRSLDSEDNSDSQTSSAPDVTQSISNQYGKLITLCFVGFDLSILSLLCFRYFVKQFIWTMLIISLVYLFAFTGYLWYCYASDTRHWLRAALLFTVVSIFSPIWIFSLSSEISLLVFFYKQAHKAVFAMASIFLEPLLTLVSGSAILALYVYTSLAISSSGTLEQVSDYTDLYDYQPDDFLTMGPVHYFNFFITLWLLYFCLACQQIVISGAVAAYYFALDKSALVSPIYDSFFNLVRFHLGSASYGSLILTSFGLLKMWLRLGTSHRCFRLIYSCCLRPIENFTKHLSSMGYIEVALHGQPLCRSCYRAVDLIIHNFLSSVALNYIGSFVFFMIKLLITVITVFVGAALGADNIIIALGALVAFLGGHCIFVVFETAVDTIFLCYCEDQMINNGDDKPFCSSVDLYNEIKKVQQAAIEKAEKNK